MGRRKKTEEKFEPLELTGFKNLKAETIQTVVAIMLFALALFLMIAAFGKAGYLGEKIYGGMSYLLGIGYYLLPTLSIMLGISSLKSLSNKFGITHAIGSGLFLLSGLSSIDIIWKGRGGEIGNLISTPFLKLFDVYASLIILFSLITISLLIIFDTPLRIDHFVVFIWKKIFTKKEPSDEDEEEKILEDHITINKGEESATPKEVEEEKEEVKAKVKEEEKKKAVKKKEAEEEMEIRKNTERDNWLLKPYNPPPINLLERDKGKPEVGDIKANANIIKRTLLNFGINVEMDEVSIGPSITRYAMKPAEGVKLSRIVTLQDNLAYALAAKSIRIEAPIPGKSLVGIEIPNTVKSTVGLASMLSALDFTTSDKPLLVSLGKDISGKPHFGNFAKMPHLLIAGATGSGKSVTIHTVITSLLYRNSPEHLKFIMIDPKRVELTLYNNIPHLLTPVITEPKKAILSLKWAAKEMDRRYDILEKMKVRDIDSYHKNILEPELKLYREEQKNGGTPEIDDEGKKTDSLPETMPYIVIVIDELADIMQSYPRELEAAIVRLAQMSRAVGIHLLLSTQRPSVNVITGLIKANVPSRLALQVASQIDSRTILDASGAEKLLGAGDMLYISGEMSKPIRLQSAYVSENEVKKVSKYLAETYKNELPDEINLSTNGTDIGADKNAIFSASMDSDEDMDDEDDLYEEAKAIVLEAKKASTSYLQRKLRIGYSRAARLMDILENKGVIGSADGSRAREILGANTSAGFPEQENSIEDTAQELDSVIKSSETKEEDTNDSDEIDTVDEIDGDK